MMKKDFNSIVKTCVCILFVVSVCFVASCKKSPEKPTSAPKVSKTTTPQTPAPSTPKAPVVKTVAETPTALAKPAVVKTASEAPAKPAISSAPAASTQGLVPVDIQLPRPMFVGTPTDIRVANLEKPLGQPRPPFLAPPGTKNVALHKPVTSSDEEPIIGEIAMITDGDKEAADGSYVELGPFVQHVTIDLQGEYNIYGICVWHYHKEARVYFGVVVQVADDPDFIKNVQTVFNNDVDNSDGLGVGKDLRYIETNEGNTSNDLNHYIEVEVYGTPVK
jgi:hypothetical protein